MAYEFKRLSNVSAVDSVSDNTNVLIEENGTIKKVSKSAVGETAEKIIGKIAEVATIDNTSDSTNVIIEENGEIKRVSKSAVGETAESVISKIAEVPSTTSVTDTTNVLIEEDGEIKKAPKSAVHGKRELVYEWTPGIDADGNPVADIPMFFQNIDEDLTWLTNNIEGIDFELELVQYGVYNDNSGNPVIDTNCEITLKTGSAYADIAFTKDKTMNTEVFTGELYGHPISFGREYFEAKAAINIMNKIQLSMENGEPIQVDIGGVILTQSMLPIKSIKIYKITH